VSAARLARLREALSGLDCDALLINRPDNRRWITNVSAHDASPTAHAGWVLVTRERAILVTSFLYEGTARAEADAVEVVGFRAPTRFHDRFAEVVRESGARRIGFDKAWFTFGHHAELREALGDASVELLPIDDPIFGLRAIKDERELAAMKRAIALSDDAMVALYGELKPGMTEAEAAWFLEAFMRTRGAEGMAFEPGVAAGPNSAIPHHKPGDRAIKAGEPIWIDIGARVDGYCSDITRTVLLGDPDARYERVWREVFEAQKRALEFVRPGRNGRECDAVARDYLASVGLAEAFGHSLGHGVGLLIHELPTLSARSDDRPLAPGMIVTVEPGAYVEGWGGVRHEELCVLTADGLEILTRAPKPFTL
jgi:Xaa-Pro aminopeptidase